MRFLLMLGLVVAVAGCSGPTEPVPPPEPVAALSPEHRQLAVARGQAVVAETFGLLSSNLLGAIQTGGISNALPFCSAAAKPLASSVATRRGVLIRRFTHKPRNPAGRADAVEAEVLNGFESLMAASGTTNPPPPWATNLVAGQATFFAPIVLNRELCLKCHGDPDKDIAPGDLAIIRRLYPADEATGFRLGQLRGAWRIDIPLAGLGPVP